MSKAYWYVRQNIPYLKCLMEFIGRPKITYDKKKEKLQKYVIFSSNYLRDFLFFCFFLFSRNWKEKLKNLTSVMVGNVKCNCSRKQEYEIKQKSFPFKFRLYMQCIKIFVRKMLKSCYHRMNVCERESEGGRGRFFCVFRVNYVFFKKI